MGNVKRPLSPYLSVYRPQLGSIFSIFGRITGLILVVTLLVFISLSQLKEISLSIYPLYSAIFWLYKGSFAVLGVNTGFVLLLFSFFYHLFFGVRYVFWTYTKGCYPTLNLDLYGLFISAYLIMCYTFGLSLICWSTL